jgi:caffeoyl-CoA O-methyltransferase
VAGVPASLVGRQFIDDYPLTASAPTVNRPSVTSTTVRLMRSFTVTDEVRDYAVGHGSHPPDDVVQLLRAETRALGAVGGMQIGEDQGQFLTMMARLVDARRAVEVGTFTGYSSLCIARGLAPGGSLLCCDISEAWTAVGVRAWERAGLRDRIELRIAPALQTLSALPDRADLDLVFIDADKPGYAGYWDQLVPRVRPGGVLLADNVLWSGEVADPAAVGDDVDALRAFNDKVAADDRVEVVLLTAFDGLTIARKL